MANNGIAIRKGGKLVHIGSRALGMSAVALLFAVGCSSGGSGPSGASGTVSKLLPRQQILLAAATQAKTLTSATETLTVHDSGIQNTTISGTAQFQRLPTLEVAENLTVAAGGKSTDIKVILNGTDLYLSEASLARQVGKPWLKFNLSALNSASLAGLAQLVHSVQSNNFLDLTQLYGAASNVRLVGRQTLDGVPTTEYAGSFQTAELSKALVPSLRKVLGPALQALGNGDVSFHVWIDDQHRTRKMTEIETINGLTVTTTMNITAINQPVQIAIPPAGQTFTPPGG